MPALMVVAWRRRRLLDAGFGWDLAEELAADPRMDLQFAIYQTAVSLRRRAWQEREIPLTPDAWAFVPDPAGRRSAPSAPRPRSCSPPSRTASPR